MQLMREKGGGPHPSSRLSYTVPTCEGKKKVIADSVITDE
jgi:hypothetical protein